MPFCQFRNARAKNTPTPLHSAYTSDRILLFKIKKWDIHMVSLLLAVIYLGFVSLGLPDSLLGSAWPARWSLIAANIWRGIPFVAISLLAGLQTISPSLYEAALLDGSTAWQRFRFITFPMLLPILAIVMTFSIIFTFTDFQLVYAITRGGPVNSTRSPRPSSRARCASRSRSGPSPISR